jgi:hypothetical protein
MPKKTPEYHLNVKHFPPELKRKLRMLALQRGTTLRDLIVSTLTETAKSLGKSAAA